METEINWNATTSLMRLTASHEELRECKRREEALRGKVTPSVRPCSLARDVTAVRQVNLWERAVMTSQGRS